MTRPEVAVFNPARDNLKDWSIPVHFVDADRTPKHDVAYLQRGANGVGFDALRQNPIPDGAVTPFVRNSNGKAGKLTVGAVSNGMGFAWR